MQVTAPDSICADVPQKKDAGTVRHQTDIFTLFPNKKQEKELGVCAYVNMKWKPNLSKLKIIIRRLFSSRSPMADNITVTIIILDKKIRQAQTAANLQSAAATYRTPVSSSS